MCLGFASQATAICRPVGVEVLYFFVHCIMRQFAPTLLVLSAVLGFACALDVVPPGVKGKLE
jgi:hypothetical protein